MWNWQIIRAGSFRLDGGSMFGIIPRTLWSRNTASDELNRISLQTNCVLLQDGKRTVLIESGYGTDWSDKLRQIYGMEDRWILPALNEAGIDADQVTDVILTHLHFDHGGGVTMRGENGSHHPTFPNAKIHVQKTEWEDALANRTTMRGTYLKENLEPIRAQIDLLHGQAQPVPGITVFPAPGHTWGQQAVCFDDAHRTHIFPGDILPTAAHVDSACNMAFDMLPYQNLLTKRALFERCVRDDCRLILPHEPGEPVRRVLPDDNSARPWYRLEPVAPGA